MDPRFYDKVVELLYIDNELNEGGSYNESIIDQVKVKAYVEGVNGIANYSWSGMEDYEDVELVITSVKVKRSRVENFNYALYDNKRYRIIRCNIYEIEGLYSIELVIGLEGVDNGRFN